MLWICRSITVSGLLTRVKFLLPAVNTLLYRCATSGCLRNKLSTRLSTLDVSTCDNDLVRSEVLLGSCRPLPHADYPRCLTRARLLCIIALSTWIQLLNVHAKVTDEAEQTAKCPAYVTSVSVKAKLWRRVSASGGDRWPLTADRALLLPSLLRLRGQVELSGTCRTPMPLWRFTVVLMMFTATR
ncbi:hypothetical protein AGIG_G24232 [Arapaima gigas]